MITLACRSGVRSSRLISHTKRSGIPIKPHIVSCVPKSFQNSAPADCDRRHANLNAKRWQTLVKPVASIYPTILHPCSSLPSALLTPLAFQFNADHTRIDSPSPSVITVPLATRLYRSMTRPRVSTSKMCMRFHRDGPAIPISDTSAGAINLGTSCLACSCFACTTTPVLLNHYEQLSKAIL